MGSDWPVKSIAECAADEPYSTQIGPFGKALMASEYTASGVPVLRGVNVNQGRFHDDDFVFISDEAADRLDKFESHPDDVLLVHKGTLGQIGLMPFVRKYPRYIMGNSMLRVRCDRSKLMPEYLYYWLSSSAGQSYLTSRVSQVGVPQIQKPLTSLREAELPVPPLAEQEDIVEILGSLDDNIELNRRTNATLESMVRAIFKSWFIDFEPVQAKAAGASSYRGMPQEFFEQLPEKFVETELGLVPAGWKLGRLGDVAEHPRQGVQPEEIAPETPYIGLQHMPRHSIALSDWGEADSVSSNKHRFSCGDVLFGKLRPYFHKVGIAPVNGVCSTDIVVVRPKSEEWFGFALGHLSSDEFVAYTTAASTGTKMPRTNWRDMSSYQIIIPPPPIAKEYTLLMRSLTDKIVHAVHEARTLADLRDTLLPKLISGEIRVPPTKRGAKDGG